MKRKSLSEPVSFEWDEGNSSKNWEKHKVSKKECEYLFSHNPIVMNDLTHSQKEDRFIALGKVNKRYLFIIYTIRNKYIRIISARDQNKKEKMFYHSKRKI